MKNIIILCLLLIYSCDSKLSQIKVKVRPGSIKPTYHVPDQNITSVDVDSIADQLLAFENTPITPIDANDLGDDFDNDNNPLTYSCFFDQTVDATVASVTNCSTLTGIAFNTANGQLTWTPNFAQSGDYEFKIVGTNGTISDEEIFRITIGNTNRAPVLDAIADQPTATENSPITTVNANDGGDDIDIDGDTLTYSCHYDSTIDSSVATSTLCSTITGLSFNPATGAMTWTPDFTQAGSYEFMITATDSVLSDDEIFVINVADTPRPPILDAIADQLLAFEGTAITPIDANDLGDDFDSDNNSLTYSCFYDQVIDGVVASVTNCSNLAGLAFNSINGQLTWTPDFTQSGDYDFKIVGTNGTQSDEEIFRITIGNTNRAPVLDAIADQPTATENSPITTVNANDGGDDIDIDGDTLTYSCHYDSTIDSSVATSTLCSTITGLSFNPATGAMTWTPDFTQAGTYEFLITATDGTLSDNEIFVINVADTPRPPILDAIADQLLAFEGTAITPIDANDLGDDFDSDNNSLTYSCFYDQVIDGVVALGTDCSFLDGLFLNPGSGLLTWTPTFDQEGTYELKLVATNGSLSDDEIFVISINNTNRAPILDAIADQSGAIENTAITPIDAGQLGVDIDADGDSISYTCHYDTVSDSTVLQTQVCSAIIGVNFNPITGEMSWTPDFNQAGTYEFLITATDGTLSDNEIFVINVNNFNRSPVLDVISDQVGAVEASPIITIDAADGGNDTDIDNESLTYTCYFDNNIDGVVSTATSCTNLEGLTFSSSSGVLNWIPAYNASGDYEFRINGSDGELSDDTLFVIQVANNDQIFASRWRTTVPGETITLPLRTGFNYNFTVNWGDGSPLQIVTSATDPDINHTYSSPGFYNITISGTAQAWFFNNTGSRLNIIQVYEMGNLGWLSLASAFNGCSNLVSFGPLNSSLNTDFSAMFLNATSLTSVSTHTFNTSNATNMLSMFQGVSALVNLDLSSFQTNNVLTMQSMFRGMTSLQTLNISNFNTANVTNVSYMFFGASALSTLDLNHFNTGNVTNMAGMFSTMTSLTSLMIDNFQTNLVQDMQQMFYGIPLVALNLNHFNTSSVTNFYAIFSNMTLLQNLNISNFTTTAATNMADMFRNTRLTDLDLSQFDTTNVINMSYMFADMRFLTSLNISSFNTTNVVNMRYMFWNVQLLTGLDLSHFNTSKVTNMESMFRDMFNLSSLNISSFNTALVTNMSYMFGALRSLTTIDVSSFNTALVTNMSFMFSGMHILASINVSNFNTANVTNMENMFNDLRLITTLDVSNFNTSKVTNMTSMFRSTYALTSITGINSPSFNTSLVTSFAGMFAGARSLTSLDLSTFNTSSATSMFAMFDDARSIMSLNVSSFNTSNVTNMAWMFKGMNALTSLDVSNFITSQVTTMGAMFDRTLSLTTLTGLENFDTSMVTNMDNMFSYTSLSSLDLSTFDTQNLTSAQFMFWDAPNLTNLNLNNWNTSKLQNMNSMFLNLPASTLDVSHFSTAELTNANSAFDGMTNLTSLNLSSWTTPKLTNMRSMFSRCHSITTLDLSSFNTSLVTNMNNLVREMTNLSTLNVSGPGWDINPLPSAIDIYTATNPAVTVLCNPATLGQPNFFGKTCN